MAVPKIVVVGDDGWLGQNVKKFLKHSAIGISGSEARKLISAKNPRDALLSLTNIESGASIINCVGARHGTYKQMQMANIKIPYELSCLAFSLNFNLIHFGSAAEYGLCSRGSRLTESSNTSPISLYGRSKLAGTMKVLENPNSVVLRVFNLVGPKLGIGNPLLDIYSKVLSASKHKNVVTLQNKFTTRDFISIAFVLKSLDFSLRNKLTGIYNICSGTPIAFGDIATEIATRIAFPALIASTVNDLSDYVVGDPTKFKLASGLIEHADTRSVVDWLTLA